MMKAVSCFAKPVQMISGNSFVFSLLPVTTQHFDLQYLLRRASLTAEDAFAFLKTDNDGDHITFMGFCETLRQVYRICNANNHSYDCLDKLNVKIFLVLTFLLFLYTAQSNRSL